LQPFVVTLCGLLIYRGWARWLSDDQSVGFGNEYTDSLSWFSLGRFSTTVPWAGPDWTLHVPYVFFVLVVVAFLAMLLLNWTIWGRYMLALGRNEEAARFSGINTGAIKRMAYTLCGLLAGLCGILFAIESGSISPSNAGSYFELYAIAAAVLGGCSLRGGEGSISGVIIGTALMQTLNNMITLLKIPNTIELVVLGGVILLGVIFDEAVRAALGTLGRGRQSK
jgi:ribose transport system permease protein